MDWETQTAYVQQYNILNRSGSTLGEGNDSRNKRHIGNPRENIINSLTQDVTKDVHKGDYVIILGDLNEDVLTDNRFSTNMQKLGIINVLAEKFNPSETLGKIRSYNRGRTIIDGIWMSGPLLPMVEKVGLAPFYNMFTSDYRGCFMDVDLKYILDDPPIEFKHIKFRRLQSSIPRRTQSYAKVVKGQWEKRKMREKNLNLEDEIVNMTYSERVRMLNVLDKQIGEILRCAKKSCTKISKNAINDWSPRLGNAIKQEREIKKQLPH